MPCQFFCLAFIFFITTHLIATTDHSTNESDIEGDNSDNYTFLITAGYRPVKSELEKYIVSLQYNEREMSFGDNHGCCGSIIGTKIILTAAHCVTYGNSDEPISLDKNVIHVVAGTPNLVKRIKTTREYKVKSIIVHPSYNWRRITLDIAILHLESEIELDGKSREIVPLIDFSPEPGLKCIAYGWGAIFAGGPRTTILTYANLTIFSPLLCNIFSVYEFCAGSANFEVGTGAGDSGGPLMCNGKLAGVCSSGWEPVDMTQKLTQPLYTFYVNVYEVEEWILKNGAVKHFEIMNMCIFLQFFLLFLKFYFE